MEIFTQLAKMASTISFGIEVEILIEFEHRRDITSSTGTDTSPNTIPVSPELPIYSSGITQEASYHAGRIVMVCAGSFMILQGACPSLCRLRWHKFSSILKLSHTMASGAYSTGHQEGIK